MNTLDHTIQMPNSPITASASTEDWLRVDEVSEITGFSPWTVRRWVHEGNLPAVRVGGRSIRVLRTELDKFLVSQPRYPS